MVVKVSAEIKFFVDNTPLYDEILNKYNYVGKLIDYDWIERFFGKKLDSTDLYLSAVNVPSFTGTGEMNLF